MATQSRNVIDEHDLLELRREYGLDVASAMEAAVEETKDTVVAVATNVVSGVSAIAMLIDHGGAYYIAGIITGIAVMVLARLLP
jgi:post-segregation antitoxin (ccd killing protein)